MQPCSVAPDIYSVISDKKGVIGRSTDIRSSIYHNQRYFLIKMENRGSNVRLILETAEMVKLTDCVSAQFLIYLNFRMSSYLEKG